jgi:N-acetylglucosaminyldiphosphoundecaprenol N-acetyl-beta-D-mannosaminyltransferase
MSSKVLDIKIDTFDSKEHLKLYLENALTRNHNPLGLLSTTNPEFIVDAHANKEFKYVLNDSFLSIPDGIGIILGLNYLNSNYQNNIIKLVDALYSTFIKKKNRQKKITGVEIFELLLEIANTHSLSVYFLGGRPLNWRGSPLNPSLDLATELIAKVKKDFPKINIIGGTSKFSPNLSDDKNTLGFINASVPVDIIFVAYGHVHQELWIQRNLSAIPARLGVGVGGTFDYFTGYNKPPPSFIKSSGLEWFYRLIINPWRIKRIYKATVVYLRMLLSSNK